MNFVLIIKVVAIAIVTCQAMDLTFEYDDGPVSEATLPATPSSSETKVRSSDPPLSVPNLNIFGRVNEILNAGVS